MKFIRKRLGLTTCALLSNSAHSLEAVDNAWQIDSSLLYYSEVDRVNVTKAIANVKGIISDKDSVTLKAVFDTMSGATPSGAVQQTAITFTGVSGGGVDASGKASSLAQFDDTRTAFNLDWNHQANRELSYVYNGAVSVENDYRSFSVGTTLNKEFNNKTFKITAGIAGTYDQVFRVGGNDTPEQLSRVEDGNFLEEGEKTTVDGILGLTYIVNKRTVAQLNIGASLSQGYLTDPYKLISIVDANHIEYDQYYEKRPGSRKRYTMSSNINHQLYPSNDILHASYRLYTDDWGITSHTVSASLKKTLGNSDYFEPVVRIYRQSAADFYANAFTHDPASITPITSVLPDLLSADYRLDGMYSLTLGVTYGMRLNGNNHLRLRASLVHQSYDDSEFESLNSYVLQASYGKKF